jgi:hypothetical protein
MLAALEAQLVAALGRPAALAAALQTFVSSGQLAQIVERVAAAHHPDAPDPAPGGVDAGALALIRAPRFALSVQVVPAAGGPFCIPDTDQLVIVLARHPVEVIRYRVSANIDLDVFDPTALLVELDRRAAGGDPIWERRADRLVHDYRAAAPFARLCLALRPSTGQAWVFDRATLRASFPMLGSRDDSGSIALCRIVAALAEHRALPMLLDLAAHPSHAVRWAAIQAIGKLDGAEARRLLDRAATDPHPHIRAAAQRTLSRLDP